MISREDFAPSCEVINEAIDRLLSGMKLGPTGTAVLKKCYPAANRSGNPSNERQILQKAFFIEECEWLWYNRSLEDFERFSIWPFIWKRLGVISPVRWNELPKDIKIELLIMTLGGLVYQIRDWQNICQIRSDICSPTMQIVLTPSQPSCDAEAHFCSLNQPSLGLGRSPSLPPFFPGDGSHLVASWPRRGASGDNLLGS